MKILAVDDKSMPRKVLVRAIEEAAPEAQVVACSSAAEVLALPDIHSFDVAFLDIDMPGKSGIELANDLKKINPRLNIVFATGFGEFMGEAFALHSSGYLTKPITAADVAEELANLRFPAAVEQPGNNKLVVQCFGDFEVFANGRAVCFERTKTKELLAFLVDRRGAVVSLREVDAVLWETPPHNDRTSGSYLRTLVSDLKRSLEACGHADVLVRRYGEVGVDATRLSCDYYDFLAGDPLAENAWRGEYMNQYSWAESTKAALMR